MFFFKNEIKFHFFLFQKCFVVYACLYVSGFFLETKNEKKNNR